VTDAAVGAVWRRDEDGQRIRGCAANDEPVAEAAAAGTGEDETGRADRRQQPAGAQQPRTGRTSAAEVDAHRVAEADDEPHRLTAGRDAAERAAAPRPAQRGGGERDVDEALEVPPQP
jgi:hypothetical protein